MIFNNYCGLTYFNRPPYLLTFTADRNLLVSLMKALNKVYNRYDGFQNKIVIKSHMFRRSDIYLF